MRSYVPICSRSRSPAVGFWTLECRLSHRLFVSWTGFAKRTDFGSSASRYHHQLYPAFTSLPNTICHLSHAPTPHTNSSTYLVQSTSMYDTSVVDLHSSRCTYTSTVNISMIVLRLIFHSFSLADLSRRRGPFRAVSSPGRVPADPLARCRTRRARPRCWNLRRLSPQSTSLYCPLSILTQRLSTGMDLYRDSFRGVLSDLRSRREDLSGRP